MARGAGCPSVRLFGTGGPTSENQPLSLHHHHHQARNLPNAVVLFFSLHYPNLYLLSMSAKFSLNSQSLPVRK